MSSAMVDATLAAPPLDHTARRRARPAALSNANANACAGAVAAAPNKPKARTVASRYLTPSPKPTSISSSASAPASRPSMLRLPAGARHHDDADARGRVAEPGLLPGDQQGEVRVARRGAGVPSPRRPAMEEKKKSEQGAAGKRKAR